MKDEDAPAGMPPARFWQHVDASEGKKACWPWLGSIKQGDAGSGGGYGAGSWKGKHFYAHRRAWELRNGPIPEGMQIDHLCRNRRCCNPTHMEIVTRRENILRGTAPPAECAARDSCAHGHPYTPENTHIDPRGDRRCRECKKRLNAEYRERHRADLNRRKRERYAAQKQEV